MVPLAPPGFWGKNPRVIHRPIFCSLTGMRKIRWTSFPGVSTGIQRLLGKSFHLSRPFSRDPGGIQAQRARTPGKPVHHLDAPGPCGVLLAGIFLFLFPFFLPAQSIVSLKVAVPTDLKSYIPMMKAIYQECGFDGQFQIYPNIRSMLMVQAGDCDAEMAREGKTISTFTNVIPSAVSLRTTRIELIYRKDYTARPLSRADLIHLRVGCVRGISFGEMIMKEWGLTGERTPDMDGLIKLIAGKRVDVGLTVDAIPRSTLNLGLVYQEEPLLTIEAFHLFNAKHADLVPRFDAALLRMKADGRLKKLLDEVVKAP